MRPVKHSGLGRGAKPKGRPVQGNSPDDRLLRGPGLARPERVCADFFPACSVVLFTILRAPRMRFLRHRGIYRPDRGSLKNQTWAGALPPAGSSHPGPRTRREDHALPIVPMSSDRLFLDRVARQCGAIGIMGKTRKELSAIMGAPGAVAVGRVCSGAHLEPVRPVWPRVA